MSPKHAINEGAGERVGPYVLVTRIGSGSMGVVYLATHELTGQVVALKKPASPDDPEALARFLQEAQHEGMMQHPNCVVMYQYFEHDGEPWIAMEYFELGTVRDLVGALSDEQSVLVLADVLRGLQHAHERNVVHRDLKPENLMRSSAGQIKIADFGISRALEDSPGGPLTDPQMFRGAIPYVAPEVVAGEVAGPAADLYGVGVIAFELLSGSVPFAELPAAKIPVAKVMNPAPKLHDRRPDLSRDLCQWVDGMLSRQPDKRPESAADARHRLVDIAESVWGVSWLRTQLPVKADPGPIKDPAPARPPSRLVKEAQLDRWSTRQQRITHALTRRSSLVIVVVALAAVLAASAVTDSLQWAWVLGGLAVLVAGLVLTTYFDEHEAFAAGQGARHPELGKNPGATQGQSPAR